MNVKTDSLIECKSVCFFYGSQQVLDGVSLSVAEGDSLGILGPNGSGKTTLLRCITGVRKPTSGTVMLAGSDVLTMERKDIARMLAVVPQNTETQFDFTVEEYVQMGRLPYVARFKKESPSDWERVEWAMRATGTDCLRSRPVTLLSGGERQRVLLAKALAQDPRVLVLDEPTSHLDLRYQIEMLDLVSRLNREEGIAVVAVLHDTNLAAAYCERIVMLSNGAVFAQGSRSAVFTQENIRQLYGLDVVSLKHPVTGGTLVFPALADPGGTKYRPTPVREGAGGSVFPDPTGGPA